MANEEILADPPQRGGAITRVIAGYVVDARHAGAFSHVEIKRTAAPTSSPVPLYLTREACDRFAKLFAELRDRMEDPPPSTGGRCHPPDVRQAISDRVRERFSDPAVRETVPDLRRPARIIGVIKVSTDLLEVRA
jgi:hypothetical protein